MTNQKLPMHLIEKGRFKGKVVDNRTRRSIEIKKEDDNFFCVDYFFHNGKFYHAKIPKSAVTKMHGQRFSFSVSNPFINHAQVRCALSKPIELYDIGDSHTKEYELTELVYSIEVVGPLGEEWSIKNSFGSFVTAHRFLSLSEVVFERVVLGKYEVIQSPPINFTIDQANSIFNRMVHRANQARMNERYYLLNAFFGANNCTSEMFKLLDSEKKSDYTLKQKILSKVLWRLPLFLRYYLKIRGAIDPNTRWVSLNEEFKDLAESQEMQERAKMVKKTK